jgi:predicted DsbA family dithiol-disulfide isomerase
VRRLPETVRISRLATLCSIAIALTFLGGASCEKSKASTDTGAIKAADEAKRPLDMTPVPGVDVSKLPEKGQKLFYKLVDSFSSPCGKAHSLRTSVKDDPACKRASFAVKYLAAMIEDEISEDDVRKLWEAKYKAEHETHTFKLDGVPREGSPDAPIKIVEFFDYGCPACMAFKPIMDEVAKENSATTVVYYKNFPLVDKHPNSMSAAQASVAAAKQGKFKEMHDTLFEHAPEQTRENVMQYAKDLGLDMERFERDYDAAEPAVQADMAEGDEAGVDGTPTIFFNGVQYEGPAHPRYFKYWIDEDLAVNR